MFYIQNANNLKYHLTNKIFLLYILLGNEIVLIEENLKLILIFLKNNNFFKKKHIFLEKKIDYENFLFIIQENFLFYKKIIIIVHIKNNIYNEFINTLNKIPYNMLSKIVIIVTFFCWLSYAMTLKLLQLNLKGLLINCNLLKNVELLNWINYKMETNNILMKHEEKLILCDYYQNNLTELKQIINLISLLWSNSYVDHNRLKKIIKNSEKFSILNWINAILIGQQKKSLRILQSLIKNNSNPLFLIQILQTDLFIIIKMKRTNKLFNKILLLKNNKISKNRYSIFINACNKYSENKIYKLINLIVSIEVSIKNKVNQYIWNKFKYLSLILL